MAVKVLLADHDLDVHKLLADLLPLLFENVSIDRALRTDDLLEKLSDPQLSYNLIILDIALSDSEGKSILSTLQQKHPQLMARIVLILDSAEVLPDGENFENFPRIMKPFSLDEFGDTLKNAVVE